MRNKHCFQDCWFCSIAKLEGRKLSLNDNKQLIKLKTPPAFLWFPTTVLTSVILHLSQNSMAGWPIFFKMEWGSFKNTKQIRVSDHWFSRQHRTEEIYKFNPQRSDGTNVLKRNPSCSNRFKSLSASRLLIFRKTLTNNPKGILKPGRQNCFWRLVEQRKTDSNNSFSVISTISCQSVYRSTFLHLKIQRPRDEQLSPFSKKGCAQNSYTY